MLARQGSISHLKACSAHKSLQFSTGLVFLEVLIFLTNIN